MKLTATIMLILVMVPSVWAQDRDTNTRTAMPSQHPVARSYDPALATTAAAAIFGFKEKKLALIDVRPAADFEKYRIAGSLNIALHALKTKAYLKSKPIVLVNDGFVVAPLALTCRALNDAGFKVTMLAGGLMAWKQKGGKLIGDPFAQNQMNHISPSQLHKEKARADLVIVDASGADGSRTEELFPGVRHLPLIKNQNAADALKKLIKSSGADPFSRLVIVAAGTRENHRIQRRLAGQDIGRVFFLEGGLPAYEKHLEQMQLARRPASERKVTTSGCKSCVRDN